MKSRMIMLVVLIACTMMSISVSAFDNTTGMVAYYPFDGNADDYFGFNNGTVDGAVLTNDKDGNPDSAYHFDGIDDKIIISDSTKLQISGSLSISVLVNITDASSTSAIIAKRDSGGTNYQTDIWTNKYRFYDGSNVVYTDNTFNESVWYHIILTIDSGTIEIWVDGVNQSISSDTVSISSDDADLLIGNEVVNDLWMDGIIDEVAIWNRSLTSEEISDIYENGIFTGREPDININTPQLPSTNIYITDPIQCNATISSEVNTTVAAYYTFWVDDENISSGYTENIVNGTETNIGTLLTGFFAEEDEVKCSVTGTDGTYLSEEKNSSTITVQTASLTLNFYDIYDNRLNNIPIVYRMQNESYTIARGFGIKYINSTGTISNQENIYDRNTGTAATIEQSNSYDAYIYIGMPCGQNTNQTLFFKTQAYGGTGGNPEIQLYNSHTNSFETVIESEGTGVAGLLTDTYNITFNNSDCRYTGLGRIYTGAGTYNDLDIYAIWINHIDQPILEEVIEYPYPIGNVTYFVDDIYLNDQYAESTQLFTASLGTQVSLDSYLIQNSDVVPTQFYVVDSQTSQPISNALVSAQLYIDDKYVTISQLKTDSSGNVLLNLFSTEKHKIIVSKTGYVTKTVASLTPTATQTYTIMLDQDYSLNYTYNLEGLIHRFNPENNILNQTKIQNLSFEIYHSQGQITSVRYNVSWNGTEIGYAASTDHIGTTLYVEFNPENKTGNVIAEAYVKINSSTYILNKTYYISSIDGQGSSMNDALVAIFNSVQEDSRYKQMYGLVGFVVILLIVGMISIISPIGAGIVGILLAAILFIPVGIITWSQFALMMMLVVTVLLVMRGGFM